MELLNLDSLVKIERKVTIGGKEYAVAKQTVGQMLNAVRLANMEEDSPERTLEALIEAAKQIIPGCPEKTIHTMSVEQITALLEFSAASDKVIEEAAKEGEVEGE